MNENHRDYCGDGNALVAFLYDECEPAEREGIAAHVAQCASCAAEIESLGATRTRLAAWTPPAAALGFRVTRESPPGRGRVDEGVASGPATVLTSPRWWSRPLPAWAQAAAALVIFAGGMAIGARSVPAGSERAVSQAAAPAIAAVSQQDFDALRAEVSRLRAVAAPAAGVNEDAVLRRVSTLVDQRVGQSEERLRNEFDRETAQLVRDFQTVRAEDLRTVQASVAGLQRVAGTELMQQRQAISQWNQIFQAGQVVPTSLVR